MPRDMYTMLGIPSPGAVTNEVPAATAPAATATAQPVVQPAPVPVVQPPVAPVGQPSATTPPSQPTSPTEPPPVRTWPLDAPETKNMIGVTGGLGLGSAVGTGLTALNWLELRRNLNALRASDPGATLEELVAKHTRPSFITDSEERNLFNRVRAADPGVKYNNFANHDIVAKQYPLGLPRRMSDQSADLRRTVAKVVNGNAEWLSANGFPKPNRGLGSDEKMIRRAMRVAPKKQEYTDLVNSIMEENRVLSGMPSTRFNPTVLKDLPPAFDYNAYLPGASNVEGVRDLNMHKPYTIGRGANKAVIDAAERAARTGGVSKPGITLAQRIMLGNRPVDTAPKWWRRYFGGSPKTMDEYYVGKPKDGAPGKIRSNWRNWVAPVAAGIGAIAAPRLMPKPKQAVVPDEQVPTGQ